MMTDPIADMLTRIRNAIMVKKEFVNVNYSKLCENIVKILREQGFIKNYKTSFDGNKGTITIYLKYNEDKEPVIHEIKRVSKPGLRKYIKAKNIRPYKSGIGVRILSTNQGVITDKEAKKRNVGGEIICEIW